MLPTLAPHTHDYMIRVVLPSRIEITVFFPPQPTQRLAATARGHPNYSMYPRAHIT